MGVKGEKERKKIGKNRQAKTEKKGKEKKILKKKEKRHNYPL